MPLIELTSDLSRKDNPQDIQKILGRPSPTAIIRDTERITKFLISPKGLLFTAKQFAQQLMNPNTENIAGIAGIGLTKIYDPISPITNTVGAPLGLRTDRHMPPIVRAKTSTYEGVHDKRKNLGEAKDHNRLVRLKNELLTPVEDDPNKIKVKGVVKFIQKASDKLQGIKGDTINTLSGITGPKSIGGIGLTTIRRYANTSLDAQEAYGGYIEPIIGKSSIWTKYHQGNLQNDAKVIYHHENPRLIEGKDEFGDTVEPLLGGDGRKPEQKEYIKKSDGSIQKYKTLAYGHIPDRSDQPSLPSRIVNFTRLHEFKKGNVKSYYDDESARQSNFENTLQLIETYDNAKAVDNPENYSIIDFQFDDIKFKAYLGSLSDNFAPSWNSAEDQGRADARYQYGGFERSISFDFMVAIENRDDATVIWQKLQDLARLTHPVYGSQGFFGQTVDVTIGKLFDARPMIIQDLGYDWDSENPWEIDPDRQHPMYTSVAMSCIVLGNRPQSNSKLYDIQGLE